MRHTVVPAGERDAFRSRARETLRRYADAGCRYWLYEEDESPGAYVEFYEAADAATLRQAHDAAAADATPRFYVEVDLT